MRQSRFSEEQMVKILREADAKPIGEVAKKHGVSDQTIYACCKRFATPFTTGAPLRHMPIRPRAPVAVRR